MMDSMPIYSSLPFTCMLVSSFNSSTCMVPQECILGSHNSAITDIAWAPSMGRSYHMIATASRESSFKVGPMASFIKAVFTITHYPSYLNLSN